MNSKRLLWIGLAMYAVAWFVPVVDNGTTLTKGGIPGWEALRFALSPIWPLSGIRSGAGFGAILSTLSGLTNLAVLWVVVSLARPASRPHARTLGWALLIATAVNASWISPGEIADLRIGYYLWLGSFLVMAIGALGVPREGIPATASLVAA